MKSILITGAGGFIGKVLCQNLLSLGYNIKILARLRQDSASEVLCDGCKIFTIDQLKPSSVLSDAMRDVDLVIHLAARVHVVNEKSANPLHAFREVNVEWTKRLVEVALTFKVKRFIFISTLNLYVDGSCYKDKMFCEEDVVNPKTPYAISKYEAEQYLNDVAKKTDMEVVIIRPPLVYGPGVKANFLSLLKLTKTGLPFPVGSLNNKRSMISIDNLVDFIACCIEHPKAANETFLISDDCDITTKELFEKLIKLFGKRALLFPVPIKIMYFFGSLFGKKSIVDRLCAPLQVDITKAKTMLGWKPVQTLDDGLQEVVTWYKKEHLS